MTNLIKTNSFVTKNQKTRLIQIWYEGTSCPKKMSKDRFEKKVIAMYAISQFDLPKEMTKHWKFKIEIVPSEFDIPEDLQIYTNRKVSNEQMIDFLLEFTNTVLEWGSENLETSWIKISGDIHLPISEAA